MNYKMIGRFLSQIVMLEAVFLLPALGISLYRGEDAAVRGFLCALVVMVLGFALSFYLGDFQSNNAKLKQIIKKKRGI